MIDKREGVKKVKERRSSRGGRVINMKVKIARNDEIGWRGNKIFKKSRKLFTEQSRGG